MIDVYESQRTSCPPSMERLRGGTNATAAAAAVTSSKTQRDGIHLDLIYVTERIISISFPAVGIADAAYREQMGEVAKMLQLKHGSKFAIFNLSDKRSELAQTKAQVLDFFWPENLAPPLEKLCSICKAMDSWLNSDPHHVVVIHCMSAGGTMPPGRTGVVVAAYLHYSNICASADQALDRLAMQRVYDEKLCRSVQPSQKRYIQYFSGLLCGDIKIRSERLFLHYVVLRGGSPNYDGKGGCRVFLKIYQGMAQIFNSPVYCMASGGSGSSVQSPLSAHGTLSEDTRRSMTPPSPSSYSSSSYSYSQTNEPLCIPVEAGLHLRGDILVKCYHKRFRCASRETVFRLQFHTCALPPASDVGPEDTPSTMVLSFKKQDLDDASVDDRFPDTFRVDLVFSSTGDPVSAVLPSLSDGSLVTLASSTPEDIDAAAVSAADPLIRWDSYENFREGESPVSQGDGSGDGGGGGGGGGSNADRGRESAASCSSASTTSPPPPSQSTPCSSTSSPPPQRRSPSPFSSASPLPVVAELQEEKEAESSPVYATVKKKQEAQSVASDQPVQSGFENQSSFDSTAYAEVVFRDGVATSDSTPPSTATPFRRPSSSSSSSSKPKEVCSSTRPTNGSSSSSSSSNGSSSMHSSSADTVIQIVTSSSSSAQTTTAQTTINEIAGNSSASWTSADTNSVVTTHPSSPLQIEVPSSNTLRSIHGGSDLLKENDLLSKTAELDDLLNELLQESDGMDDPSLTTPHMTTIGRLSSDDHRLPWWSQPQTAPAEETDGSYVVKEEMEEMEAVGKAVDRNDDSPRPPPRGTSVAVMDGYIAAAVSHYQNKQDRGNWDVASSTKSASPTQLEASSPTLPGNVHIQRREQFLSGKPIKSASFSPTSNVSRETDWLEIQKMKLRERGGAGLNLASPTPLHPGATFSYGYEPLHRGMNGHERTNQEKMLVAELKNFQQRICPSTVSSNNPFHSALQAPSSNAIDDQTWDALVNASESSPHSPATTVKKTVGGLSSSSSTDPLHPSVLETQERSYWGTKSIRYPPPRDGIPIPEELRPLISPEVTPRVRSAESLVTAVGAHLAEEGDGQLQQQQQQQQGVLVAELPTIDFKEKEPAGLLFDIPPPPPGNYSLSAEDAEVDALTAFDVESQLEANRVVVVVDDNDDSPTPSRAMEKDDPSSTFSSAHLRAANEREDFLDRLSGTASESPNSVVNIGGVNAGGSGRDENDVSRYENHQSSPLQSPIEQPQRLSPSQQHQLPLSPSQQQGGSAPRPRPNVDALLEMLDDATTRLSVGSTTTTTTATSTMVDDRHPERVDGIVDEDSVDCRIVEANHRQLTASSTRGEGVKLERTEGDGRSVEKTVPIANGDAMEEIRQKLSEDDATLKDSLPSVTAVAAIDNQVRPSHPPTSVDAILDEMHLNQTAGDEIRRRDAAATNVASTSSSASRAPTDGIVEAPSQRLVTHHLTVETDDRFLIVGSSPSASLTHNNDDNQRRQPLTPNFPLESDNHHHHHHHPFGNGSHVNQTSPSHTQAASVSGVETIVDRNVITFVDVEDGNESASSPLAPPSSGATPLPPTSPSSEDDVRDRELTTTTTTTAAATSVTTMTSQRPPVSRTQSSRRSSHSSQGSGSEVVRHHPVFVRDTSQYWYKPTISREDAISVLKDKSPGTFIVRDSNSFPGAFGLAVKVATLPPNIAAQHQRRMKMEGCSERIPSPTPEDLVRHFLIEPTPRGVRLKGCLNEPTFASLAALVYQHSITRLALPCELLLPTSDPIDGFSRDKAPTNHDVKQSTGRTSSPSHLLSQGAACKVLYLNSVDMESLTGPQAVKKAMNMTLDNDPAPPTPTIVHFKVTAQGITLTDNQRKVFFRRHYPVHAVTYCGVDPEDKRCFGFVARKDASGIRDARHNQCHVFAALEADQPASAIVNFVTKVMIGSSSRIYTQ